MGSLKWVETVDPSILPLYKGMLLESVLERKVSTIILLYYPSPGITPSVHPTVNCQVSNYTTTMWPLSSWALCLTLLTTTILASPIQIQKRAQGPWLALDTNFPDPSFVQHDDGKWYAFGTNGNGKRVQVATSPDFKTWTLLDKEILPTLAGWETEVDHWAPDVIRRVCDSSPHGLIFNLLFINYYSYVLGTSGVVCAIYY